MRLGVCCIALSHRSDAMPVYLYVYRTVSCLHTLRRILALRTQTFTTVPTESPYVSRRFLLTTNYADCISINCRTKQMSNINDRFPM